MTVEPGLAAAVLVVLTGLGAACAAVALRTVRWARARAEEAASRIRRLERLQALDDAAAAVTVAGQRGHVPHEAVVKLLGHLMDLREALEAESGG